MEDTDDYLSGSLILSNVFQQKDVRVGDMIAILFAFIFVLRMLHCLYLLSGVSFIHVESRSK